MQWRRKFLDAWSLRRRAVAERDSALQSLEDQALLKKRYEDVIQTKNMIIKFRDAALSRAKKESCDSSSDAQIVSFIQRLFSYFLTFSLFLERLEA